MHGTFIAFIERIFLLVFNLVGLLAVWLRRLAHWLPTLLSLLRRLLHNLSFCLRRDLPVLPNAREDETKREHNFHHVPEAEASPAVLVIEKRTAQGRLDGQYLPRANLDSHEGAICCEYFAQKWFLVSRIALGKLVDGWWVGPFFDHFGDIVRVFVHEEVKGGVFDISSN